MTYIESKHRQVIRDSLVASAMIRFDNDEKKSKALVHGFLNEMKDRR